MAKATRHRASVVCVHDRRLLCVRLRDPRTGVTRLFVPGGAIEPGETAAGAAERETLEETGYAVCVDPGSELVAGYRFVWAAEAIDCTTHFFRARLRAPEQPAGAVADADFNLGTVWLPLDELEAALGFHAEILAAVRALATP